MDPAIFGADSLEEWRDRWRGWCPRGGVMRGQISYELQRNLSDVASNSEHPINPKSKTFVMDHASTLVFLAFRFGTENIEFW